MNPNVTSYALSKSLDDLGLRPKNDRCFFYEDGELQNCCFGLEDYKDNLSKMFEQKELDEALRKIIPAYQTDELAELVKG